MQEKMRLELVVEIIYSVYVKSWYFKVSILFLYYGLNKYCYIDIAYISIYLKGLL
ncbi:hypothetical protein [Clostridium perfringens]|uniref:hypothetical protein n=1 Tax=Clostridium perfringens TaxID=1502 RepID=UPI00321A6CDC